MTWRPFPFAGGSYKDDTLPWSAQDTVNWLPVVAEVGGTRTPIMLRGVPGLTTTANHGGALSAFDGSGSRRRGIVVRGAYNADGVFVVVQGTTCYRYNGEWKEPTVLGTVPGVERVSITHNQITGGSQIVIANGQAGYVYNTVTGDFAQITDEGFPGAKCVDYIDSYIVAVEPGGRFWFASALADATSYNTLDRYEAESAPDKIVGLIVSHSEVIVFGERTMEFYYDSGANTGTFQRRDGTQTEVGAASTFAIVKLDNTVFWAGNDGSIYKLNGYTPQRISTQPIEQAIAKCDLSQCFAMVYADRGHKIVYFTFPDGLTWGYDVATGVWHRRQSYRMKRWRANTLTQWSGRWYAGDYTDGALCSMDWGVNTENGDPLVAERVMSVMQNELNRFRLHGVELSVDAQESISVIPTLRVAGDMPNGGTGDVVSTAYVATGGVAPFAYSVDSGSLPPGVTLDTTTGVASGTYTTVGSYSWVIKVVDALGSEAAVSDRASVKQSYLVAASSSHITYSTTGTSGWVLPTTGNPSGKYIAFGNGVFVAGQSNDLLFVSSNPADWTSHAAPGGSMGGLAFGNGRFVTGTAPGGLDAGHLYSSTNGVDWTALTHPGIQSVTSIAYLNGLFVVTCFAGGVLTSSDGETWTKYTLGSNQMRAATVSDAGVYMVAGNNGATYTSPDGKTWTLKSTQFSGAASIAYLAFFAGKYIAQLNTADLYSSSDGALWTALTPPATPNGALAVYQGKLFEGYTANVEYTSDLATWTQVSNAASSNTTQFCSGTV